jgi:DNA-binding NtrC family response regulator
LKKTRISIIIIAKEKLMIEIIKTKIWEMLKGKAVSLAMVFHGNGQILWHKGRNIKGNFIHEGEGFSKSYIKKCLNTGEGIDRENVVITSPQNTLSESALRLVIKCILIYPLENDLFLYVDSGKKESFSPGERDMFKMLGDMLAEMIKQLKQQQESAGGITGKSKAMEKVKKMVLNYAIVEEPILLKGETGVGKNYIAEKIHYYSGRKGKFVVAHTPSINENLFESEIFGHRKGAFTDAKCDKKGLVDEANGGTLLFDEISEIPLSFQTKLLRFIETKKYRVLGDSSEKKADVRIVTATNRDLIKSIEEGEFREDLFFRLHVLEIEIPPLRQRLEDIKALVMDNLDHLKGNPIGEGFWEVVLNYRWPGNVRELITFLKRAGIMLRGPVTGEDVRAIIGQGIYKKSTGMDEDKTRETWEDLNAGKSFWEVLWPRFIDREVDRYFVKEILKKAYTMSSDSFKTMLNVLNVNQRDYQKFMSLMYKYKIDPRN